MVYAHPSAPEPDVKFVELTSVPTTDNDTPNGPPIKADSDGWTPLALGTATFGYGLYSATPTTDQQKQMPLRTVRLALRYGITVIDTAAHYHPSEVIVGNSLRALKDEFPRESYKVITKCGRYGDDGFDYDPQTIEKSVRRSLDRIGCGYFDVVYLHDVEFVASPIPELKKAYHPLDYLTDKTLQREAGLAADQAGQVHGEGDAKVLAAFEVLVKLRDEGLIRQIGISGYPLPVLLRIATLLHTHPRTAPGITSLLSYAHSNLANSAFSTYLPRLLACSSPDLRILTASPINMGLLTPNGPPQWHPARLQSPALMDGVEAAKKSISGWDAKGGVIDLALGFGTRNLAVPGATDGRKVPVVVGWSNVHEVHQGVQAWRGVNEDETAEQRDERHTMERTFRDTLEKSNVQDISWASGQ